VMNKRSPFLTILILSAVLASLFITQSSFAQNQAVSRLPVVDGQPVRKPTDLPKVNSPLRSASYWELTFSDEFNGSALDRTKWATEYGFDTYCEVSNPPPGTSYCNRSNNNEKEWYIDSSPRLENGVLKLVAQKNDCSGDNLPDRNYAPYSCANFPYLSGMISTHNKFSQLYGYYEARMKVPKGQGFWPAFWIIPQLPASPSPAEYYWPPEVDIMEMKGQQTDYVHLANHYSGVYPDPGSALNGWSYGGSSSHIYVDPQDLSAGFHTYAIDWEPGLIIWYIDGVEQFRTTNNIPPGTVNPPDYGGDMHLILNLAVGGNFVDNLLPPDSVLPNSLDIDYVRVYQKVAGTLPPVLFLPHIAGAGQ
jgi:beta-glucanase (GH16 family)